MILKTFNEYQKGFNTAFHSFRADLLSMPFSEEDLNWNSSKKGNILSEKFELEYKSFIIANSGNHELLRSYLLEVYVNGFTYLHRNFSNLKTQLIKEKFKNIIQDAINDRAFINLDNHVHCLEIIINNIREFTLLNAKLKIPEIDYEGFNITGVYFKQFELNKPLDSITDSIENKIEQLEEHGSSRINIDRKAEIEKNLNSVWKNGSKMSIDEFLIKGYDAGIWDENLILNSKRGAVYGSGKTLIASLSIALKIHSINENVDHKKIGQAFSKAFLININKNTKNPYKLFQSGNTKYISNLKRLFKVT